MAPLQSIIGKLARLRAWLAKELLRDETVVVFQREGDAPLPARID